MENFLSFLLKLHHFIKIFKTLPLYSKELKAISFSDVVLICGDDDRSFDFNGIKFSPILDSLNEILIAENIITITISSPISKIFGKKAFGNVVSVNAIFSLCYLKNKFYSLLKSNYNSSIQANEESWNIILKKAQPKIIIAIQPSPELCFVANKMKIKVFDIQHGVISSEGYYNINYFKKKYHTNFKLPDLVLCWDSQSSDAINLFFNKKVRTLIVGNFWHNKFMNLNNKEFLSLSIFRKISLIKNKKFTILVTLQWGGESQSGNLVNIINKNLLNFINNNSQKYNWWIKIHPMLLNGKKGIRLKNELSSVFVNDGNIDFNICSSLPLPLLLKNTDFHITSHSAVTIEASWFGIKTALIYEKHDLLYEYFNEQIKTGMAEIIECSEDSIEDWINRNKNIGNGKVFYAINQNNINLLINNIKENVKEN